MDNAAYEAILHFNFLMALCRLITIDIPRFTRIFKKPYLYYIVILTWIITSGIIFIKMSNYKVHARYDCVF